MTNLVDEWAREFFHKPEARRRGGEMIPRFIADRLVAADQTVEWCKACLRDVWNRMQRDRGKELDRGWTELAGGILVAAGLVDETFRRTLLPVEPPVRQCYEEQRCRYDRYALVVGKAVQARRVLVHSKSREHEQGWQLVGVLKEQIAGHSHTLAISLVDQEQRNEVSLPRDRAVAATGELQAGKILPVRSLAEKCRAWFRKEPDGLLVTAPLARLDGDAWKSLVLDMGIPDHEGSPPQWPHDAGTQKALERRWALWITAASIEELNAKLALRFGDGVGEIRAWNNDVLEPTHIAPLAMRWAGEQRSQREEPLGIPLLDAVWNAMRNARNEKQGPRGVLVEGEPGAGKSLWSITVQRQFATGPLGALGYAVRAGARELVGALRQQRVESNLLEVLPAETPAQGRLHQQLLSDGRLIIVLDGLDELDEPDAHRLVELLQSTSCAFIVTSRPLKSVRHRLADSLHVSIEPLAYESSVSLLEAHGRGDLARQLSAGRYGLSPALGELRRRPFTLSLLMGAIPRGESARGLTESELYRRAYQFLIRRAHQTHRLTEEQAQVLEHSAGELIGELALAWLRGADGYIRDAELSAQLRRHGFSPREGVGIREALRSSHLLVPAFGGWEFAHRTLAEWAAAQALHRRVREVIQQDERQGRAPIDDARKGELEMAELSWLFEQHGGLYDSAETQILRFYAPHALAPERLLHALVGSEQVERLFTSFNASDPGSRFHLLNACWSSALEILASVTWHDRECARRCWGTFTRALLLPHGLYPEPDQWWRPRGILNEHAMRRFADATRWTYWPAVEELIAAAALDEEQRAYFQEDPTRLLPLCPASGTRTWDELRTRGTWAQQRAILTWDEQMHDDMMASQDSFLVKSSNQVDEIERLARELPQAIERESKRWYTDPAESEVSILRELERLAYRRAAQLGHELPWPVLRRRLQDWPGHLEDWLLIWFATRDVAPREHAWRFSGSEPDAAPAPVERRRQGIGVFLAEIAEAWHSLEPYASLPDEITRICPEALESDSDEMWSPHQEGLPGRLFDRRWFSRIDWLMRRANYPQELVDKQYSLWEIRRRLDDMRKRLHAVVKRLAGSDDWFDEVAGALWEALPDGSIEAHELLGAMEAAGRIARQVPVSVMLARLDERETALPSAWARDVRWCGSHEGVWHELASNGCGRERYLALQWCAHREGRELGEVFAVPMGQDSELDDLLLAWWLNEGRKNEELALLPPDCLVSPREMPLRYRAHWDIPGWRDTLLEQLSRPDTADSLHALLVVMRHPVPEALPLLMAQLGVERDTYEPSDEVRAELRRLTWGDGRRWLIRCILEAIIASLRAEDRDYITAIVPWLAKCQVSQKSWERLGTTLLAAEDLPVLLAIDAMAEYELPVYHDGVLCYLKRLGGSAHGAILEALEQRERDLLTGGDGEQRGRRAGERWIATLRAGALWTGLPLCLTLDQVVDLAFRVVSRRTGFLTPVDHDHLRRALEERAEQAQVPAVVDTLARLLAHPMSEIRRMALALCLPRPPAHRRGALVLRAIQEEVQCAIGEDETDMALARACHELRLPVTAGGGPSSFWELQDLFREGRPYVTAAHRDQFRAWLAHERAELRYWACTWMGVVGAASWGTELCTAMNDVHPAVAFAAVRAWCSVEPGKLDAALETLPRTNWGAAHYALFAAYWVGDMPGETHAYFRQRLRRASVEPLAPERVVQMVGEACVSLLASEGRDAVGLALLDNPKSDGDERGESLIELFLARAAEIHGDSRLGAAVGTLSLRDWAEAAPADGPLATLAPLIARVMDRWLPTHVLMQERAAGSLNEPDAVSEPGAATPDPEPSASAAFEERFDLVWAHLCHRVFPASGDL